jgi:zinc protease
MRHIETMRQRFVGAAFLLLLVVASAIPAHAEMKIQEVTTQKGIDAWLVEDYSVPLVTIRFYFEGGTAQDPAGKDGLANLMTGLFDEGAGDLDSAAFQKKLDESGAEMSFTASRDGIYGTMRLLADQKTEALDLLKMAVQSPRFDQAPIDRIRAQIVSSIRASSRDPQTEAQDKWSTALYGDHPYSRRSEGSEETLASITSEDLKAFHKAVFAREKLKIAVVGAIDAETLKSELDAIFGPLPEKPQLVEIPDVTPKLNQTVKVEYPLPQSSMQLAYPGVKRSDDDFFAAVLMNHILGGGTFSSRLFDEVREKRGLAYGVNSALVNYDHANALSIGTSTRSDRAGETLDLIKTVVRGMADEGPTEAELTAAKKYLIGGYAINNLNSSRAIASTLVELQIEGLGADYMEKRGDLINGVTLEQVKAAATKLLINDPAILIVGPAAKEESGG